MAQKGSEGFATPTLGTLQLLYFSCVAHGK